MANVSSSPTSPLRQFFPRTLPLCLLLLGLLLLPLARSVTAQAPDMEVARQAQWLALEPLAPVPTPDEAPQAIEAIEGMDQWSAIAFQSFRDGNWELYMSRGDGSVPRRITAHPASDLRPDLNHGASRVVFVSLRDGDPEIYAVNPDGSGLAQLTHNSSIDRDPRWSPDGSRIVYSAATTDGFSLYIMQADGSGRYRLTHDNSTDLMPSWSPDGSMIAWVRVVNESSGQLMTIRADGTDLQARGVPVRFLQNPTWHPDGQRIWFDADFNGDSWQDLAYRYLWDTTHTVFSSGGPFLDRLAGTFSPDGFWIAYTRAFYEMQNGQLVRTAAHLYRRDIRYFTDDRISSGMDEAPRWVKADISPPQTAVLPLPPFARAAGGILRFTAHDIGPAGMVRLDVAQQVNGGAWTETQVAPTVRTAFFSGSPGQTLGFRVRGHDDAGNIEPYPATAEATTRLFTTRLDGRVTDSRGVPMSAQPVSISPTPIDPPTTNTLGNFESLLLSTGQHLVSTARAGYGTLPPSSFSMNSDRKAALYLPGTGDLLTNGGFENPVPLNGWQVSGTLPVVPNSSAHSGARTALLGTDCGRPCFDSKPLPPGVDRVSAATTDRAGRLHILWDAPTMYYAVRGVDGVWGPTESVGPSSYAGEPTIRVSDMGTVHVLYLRSGSGTTIGYYAERSLSGQWQSGATFPANLAPDGFEVDGSGTLHIIQIPVHSDSVRYLYKPLGGVWSAPITIVPDMAGRDLHRAAMAVQPDGVVHFVWREDYYGATWQYYYLHQSRAPSGEWSTRVQITVAADENPNTRPKLDYGDNGHLYAVVRANLIIERDLSGEWLPPTSAPEGVVVAKMIATADGTLHLIGNGAYYRRSPERDWSYSQPLNQSFYRVFAVDQRNTTFLFNIAENAYHQSAIAAADKAATLSTTVAIPTSMVRPTVALAFRQVGRLIGSTAHLEVAVQSGSATTVLYEGSASDWTVAWGDLTPWRGQSVTLHLTLRQPAGDVLSQLYIDSVSVSDWLTPVVTSADPAQLAYPWAGQTVTLHGDNFFATPQVWVGRVAVTSVQRLDDQTLRIVLPATLGPGRHEIQVRDVAGRESIALHALQLGQALFAPFIHR